MPSEAEAEGVQVVVVASSSQQALVSVHNQAETHLLPCTPPLRVTADFVLKRVLRDADVAVQKFIHYLRHPSLYEILPRDVMILVDGFCRWPASRRPFPNRAMLIKLVETVLTTGLKFNKEVYSVLYLWLSAPFPTVASERNLLRQLSMKLLIDADDGFSVPFKNVSVQHMRQLFHTLPSMQALAKRLPSPHVFLTFIDMFWKHIHSDEDLAYVAHLMRVAWRRGGCDDGAELSILDCPICFETKPADMFGMLTCGSHKLCCTCILTSRALHGANPCGAVFRCPMRCMFNCTALPLPLFDFLSYELQVHTGLVARAGSRSAVVPVALTVGQYVRVPIWGSVHTWAKVQRVAAPSSASCPGVFIICSDDYIAGIVLLARSDMVLEVVPSTAPPVPASLTDTQIQYLSDHCVEILTFSSIKEDEPPQHYARVAASSYCGLWERVKYGFGQPVPYYTTEMWFSLQTVVCDMQGAFVLLPTQATLCCACCEEGHLSLQSCVHCQRKSCTACYGSPFSVCVICRGEAELGINLLDLHEAAESTDVE